MGIIQVIPYGRIYVDPGAHFKEPAALSPKKKDKEKTSVRASRTVSVYDSDSATAVRRGSNESGTAPRRLSTRALFLCFSVCLTLPRTRAKPGRKYALSGQGVLQKLRQQEERERQLGQAGLDAAVAALLCRAARAADALFQVAQAGTGGAALTVS